MAKIYLKDPQAKVDYQIDWSAWLGSDTILTSTWTVPTGLTKVSDSHDDTTTTIVLSGGSVGSIYEVVNHIVTASGGLEDDRTLRIMIEQQ